MPKTLLRILALCIVFTTPAAAISASPEIFLLEEPESYLLIDKLEGMGFLPGLMTGDRGLEGPEVAGEADKVDGTGDPFTDGMLRFLRLGAASRVDFRVRAGLDYSGDGRAQPNSQGLSVPKDGGLRVGGFFRAEPTGWLALQGRGDFQSGFDGETTGRIEETSIRIGWPQATLEAGRFSVWWGPGRHGSLLFTANAEPVRGVRLRNPRPIPLGRWLKFLGMFQYDLFVARLEESRPIPHSLLSGVRVAVRPSRYLEIGLSRAIHFGGSGRGSGISEWWEAFKGTKENEPGNEGNQLAGFDLSVTLPFRVQPVRIYLEAAGEDQATFLGVPYPTKPAYLGGIFLPALFGSRRADFRAEFARNHFQDYGPAWYVHSASGGGYAHRYRGEILGHHMGTDAQDIFLEGHYFLLPSSYLELNVDITQRSFPGPEREETWRVSGAIVAWLTKNIRAEGRLAYERISNENGLGGRDATDAVLQTALSYQYR